MDRSIVGGSAISVSIIGWSLVGKCAVDDRSVSRSSIDRSAIDKKEIAFHYPLTPRVFSESAHTPHHHVRYLQKIASMTLFWIYH